MAVLLLLGSVLVPFAGARAQDGAAWIVTSSGDLIEASTVRRAGGAYEYNLGAQRGTRRMEAAAVAGVIPVFQRGHTYSTEEIRKAVNDIGSLRRRFPKLLRRLNPQWQEWNAALKGSPDYSSDIAALDARFQAANGDPEVYHALTTELGMIRYKDFAGRHTADIDAMLAAWKADFVRINSDRIDALAAADPPTPDTFRQASVLADAIGRHADPEGRAHIEAALDALRDRLISRLGQDAWKLFAAERTVNAYLQAAADLHFLAAVAARTDPQRAETARLRDGLRKAADKVFGTQSFHGDFVLDDGDRGLIDTLLPPAHRFLPARAADDTHCLLFPAEDPAAFLAGHAKALSLRLAFNRQPDPDAEYGLVLFRQAGAHVGEAQLWELSDLRLDDGVATLSLPDWALPALPDDAALPNAPTALCAYPVLRPSTDGDPLPVGSGIRLTTRRNP